MSMTRSEFLRGAGATCLAVLPLQPGPAHAQALGKMSVDELAGITDPNRGDGVPREAWAIIDQIVQVTPAVERFTGRPAPPLPEIPRSFPFKEDFYHRLAVGLMCKTVTTIGDRGLNRLVNGNATKFVSDHIRSSDAYVQSAHVYTHLLMNRKGVNGSTLAEYVQEKDRWSWPLADFLTSPNFVKVTNLKTVGSPEKTRYDLKVSLWIMYLMSGRGTDAMLWKKVREAWLQQDSKSVFWLAAKDQWPPNLFVPNYDKANPLDGHIRGAARRTRPGEDWVWTCLISKTYFAEELAQAVRQHGGPLGLTTGADYDDVDSESFCGAESKF